MRAVSTMFPGLRMVAIVSHGHVESFAEELLGMVLAAESAPLADECDGQVGRGEFLAEGCKLT